MASFKEIISSPTPTLVDFFATWCGPCQMMPPILDELKKTMGSDLRIIKIDVDKNPKAAQQYGVKGVPLLILFKSGEIVWKQSGVRQAAELAQIVKQHT